jgi:uncharacterized membrane-anchored protein YitT (DUF2179 family)
MKRYFNIVIGSLLIALGFNIFFAPTDLICNGINGAALLFNYITSYNPALFILIINSGLILISLIVEGKKKTLKYLLPSLLIPIFILLTQKITSLITFENLETILQTISGSAIISYGSSLIYKEGLSASSIDILQDIFNSTRNYKDKSFSYAFEVIIVLLASFIISIESAVYSAIAIIIIIYMSTKSKIGISTSKTFYIITEKPEEIKDYLINELECDYTEINVKGGFTNQKNKIIMTVIDTKDYYRLKEGVTIIDPHAFISIIDNYETINKNLSLDKKLNKDT